MEAGRGWWDPVAESGARLLAVGRPESGVGVTFGDLEGPTASRTGVYVVWAPSTSPRSIAVTDGRTVTYVLLPVLLPYRRGGRAFREAAWVAE